jgi:hypothetical protein
MNTNIHKVICREVLYVYKLICVGNKMLRCNDVVLHNTENNNEGAIEHIYRSI